MPIVNRHAERSERTRSALIAAGRELFAEHGYEAVSTEEVVRAAGVTRGALYHQFPDGKRALFEAVFEQVEGDLTRRIADAVVEAGAADPLAALTAGANLFLDSCLEPEVQRITIRDAPAVLGWERWRELGGRYGLGIVRAGLAGAMETGAIAQGPVEPLAHMLLGALEEAALYVADANDQTHARAEVGETVTRLLSGLR